MNEILILEDDRPLSKNWEKGLVENDFTVKRAVNFSDLSHWNPADDPTIILLDLGLPDQSGDFLLQSVKSRFPTSSIIITSGRGHLDSRISALENGADDYLIKPFPFPELLVRIKVQIRHRRTLENNWKCGNLRVDPFTRQILCRDQVLELTPKEFSLLNYLIQNRGFIVSREKIQREIWNLSNDTSSLNNIIEVHVSHLRRKLKQAKSVVKIATLRGQGYQVQCAV